MGLSQEADRGMGKGEMADVRTHQFEPVREEEAETAGGAAQA